MGDRKNCKGKMRKNRLIWYYRRLEDVFYRKRERLIVLNVVEDFSNIRFEVFYRFGNWDMVLGDFMRVDLVEQGK